MGTHKIYFSGTFQVNSFHFLKTLKMTHKINIVIVVWSSQALQEHGFGFRSIFGLSESPKFPAFDD
jgi:hypothetical protein